MSSFRLACRNLRDRWVRTLVALLGVVGAAVLIFMQLGSRGSVARAATQLYDHLDFDLLLVSTEYIQLNRPGNFPRARLSQVRGLPGVASVVPLSSAVGLWRAPHRTAHSSILLLAAEPRDLDVLFRGGVFSSSDQRDAARSALGRLDTVLLDRQSWPEYGDPEERRPGSRAELNDRRVEVVGQVEVGTGFGYNGLLLTSESTLARVSGWDGERVTFGLVRLQPGARREEVFRSISERLRRQPRLVQPGDVDVLTREAVVDHEADFWLQSTAVGQLITLGVGVAWVVGFLFVYQIMAADIRNRLSEYAMLKALGYSPGFLARVVLSQAVVLGVVGFVPAVLLSLLGYQITHLRAHIPMRLTPGLAGSVLLLTVGMCVASGLFAVRRVHSADPADLF